MGSYEKERDVKIGIAGFGFVGQALYGSIKAEARGDTVLYDPPKGLNDHEDLFSSRMIFCCLPTPMASDGSQDFTNYQDFFSSVPKEWSGILVVKSTCTWENLSPFTEKFSIVFNPEFLNQNTSFQDFRDQHIIILGGRADHCREVEGVYKNYFDLRCHPIYEITTTEEAIQIKYIHNIYHAYKVLFWNYTQQITGNQRKIFNLYSKIRGTTESLEMARICSDGLPGYGGACFPKDVQAFNHEHPHVLTDFMSELNNNLRGS